jgi:uncharacterized protein YceK
MKKTKVIILTIVIMVLLSACNSGSSQKATEEIPATMTVQEPTHSETTVKKDYSNTLPYIGMPESALNSTLLGQPTSVELSPDFYAKRPSHQFRYYIWKKDGETIFKATVKYWDWSESKKISGVVSDIWEDANYAKRNNHGNLGTAPYVGMVASSAEISKWSWQGTDNTTCGVNTNKYRYDIGNYSYVIWINSSNKVLKVSTTESGR